MKSLFPFLLLLLLWCPAALSQTAPSSCVPTAQLVKAYKNDVADLALQRMYEIHSPDTAFIEIPQRYQDTIWQALAAVANTGAALEVDSILRNYCVHRWPQRAYKSTITDLKVDINYTWAKQWSLGNALTGNAAIDSFMARHGVIKTAYLYNSRYEYLNNFAELRATRAINFAAFTDSMLKFDGARYLSPKNTVGGSDIIYYRYDTAAHLSFFGGWGDCPSGCLAGKQWTYTVFPKNCNVVADTILVDNPFGIPKTSFANCNLSPLLVSNVLSANSNSLILFPNPTQNVLHLKGIASGGGRYHIYDFTGRLLLEGTCTHNQIATAALPAGYYFIRVWESNGTVHTQRFTKE